MRCYKFKNQPISRKTRYIPEKDFYDIRERWKAGEDWKMCSIVYELTKAEIVEIVLADEKELEDS
jgi:hypothetical protein